MKIFILRRGWVLAFQMAAVVSGVIAMAACSPTPQLQEKSDGLESLGQREGLVYDLKLDTLAYMSCQPDQPKESSAYFTFRAGGYRNGGIALKEDFVERMKEINRLAGDLPEIIQRSPVLGGATPTLAIRNSTDVQGVRPGFVSPFFVPFDNQLLLTKAVLNPGVYFRTVPREDKGPIRFEGSLYNTSQDQLELRDFLSNGNYFLAVTVGREAEKFLAARAPVNADESKSAYGVRLDLKFANNDRYLVSAQEYNLETNQAKRDKTWVCPSNMRFEIHKQHGPDCPLTVDYLNYTGYQASVRQVLRQEDWSINWQVVKDGNSYQCAVAKRGKPENCYDSDEKNLHYVSFCFLQ